MADFENGILMGQLIRHYDSPVIYVEMFPGALLFLSCMASIIIAHFTFSRDILHRGYLVRSLIISRRFEGVKLTEPGLLGQQSISAALFYTGMIGLGTAMEHLFENFILLSFFHYLTMVSPPIALYFFYTGIKKHVNRKYDSVILLKVIWSICLFIFAVGMLSLLSQFYNNVIEIFFFFTLPPVLILSSYVLVIAAKAYGKHLIFLPTVSATAILTSLLALAMLAVHLSIIRGYADIYVLAQGIKEVLISMTTASVLIYITTTRVMMKKLAEG